MLAVVVLQCFTVLLQIHVHEICVGVPQLWWLKNYGGDWNYGCVDRNMVGDMVAGCFAKFS